MRSGNYYKISIGCQARSSQTPGKFEVKFGSAPSSEAMTETVIEPKVVAIDNGKYDTYSGIVKATSSGAGHIGVHALTEAGNWWLLATNLRVSAPYESSVPQAPSELKVVPAKSGALTAEVSCIAPIKRLTAPQSALLKNRDFLARHTGSKPSIIPPWRPYSIF